MTNLIEYMTAYSYGDQFVLVETGHPQDAVRIGIGKSLHAAYDTLTETPIQSIGCDCGLSVALEWAEGAEWIGDIATLTKINAGKLVPGADNLVEL